MTAKRLMFQGTGSDVGKSLLVAGLARAFTRRGLRVAPFKPQNMSNNAAVTADGGEIGRAQALQARACGLPLSVHMNPVLLKPQSDIGSQVVVQGKVTGNATAREYQALKPQLMGAVLESYARISADADLVLVEGAGSAAEVNLRAGDIANMGFAVASQTPVVLIGDIDRGGVIASMVGTHVLLPEDERALLKGYLINKFRGDVSLFGSGLDAIGSATGLTSFGVVPFFRDARKLPAEDAQQVPQRSASDRAIRIAVPVLSRIANFDDFDPLMAEPDVSVEFIPRGQPLPQNADCIILPGSKATLADLAVMRAEGWDRDVQVFARNGGRVLGICGGLQLLGRMISDPQGVEGPPSSAEALGLLDIETVMTGDKHLIEVGGVHIASGEAMRGYEMHIGETTGADASRPYLQLGNRQDGAVSADGRIAGTYVHGLFSADGFRGWFLNDLRVRVASRLNYEAQVDAVLDALADHLEEHVRLDDLLAVAG